MGHKKEEFHRVGLLDAEQPVKENELQLCSSSVAGMAPKNGGGFAPRGVKPTPKLAARSRCSPKAFPSLLLASGTPW